MSTEIKSVKLVKTDVNVNSNKFWNACLYANGDVRVERGRIGNMIKDFYPGRGESYFDMKVREKMRKKYRPAAIIDGSIKTHVLSAPNLAEVAKRDICGKDKLLAALIDELAQENVHFIEGCTSMSYNKDSGLFSTPLGIVTPDALLKARAVLGKISDGSLSSGLINDYLMLVPQKLGSRIDVNSLFGGVSAIRKQYEILDALDASVRGVANVKHNGDTPKDKVFEASLTLASTEEFKRVLHLFLQSKNAAHHCNLKLGKVFNLSISNMDKEFDECKVGGLVEVWHGTKNCNVLSILKNGFEPRPPVTASVTGKMFGHGVYFSDVSSKACGYIDGGRWNNLKSKNRGFLILCNVLKGKSYIPSTSCPSKTSPPSGYNSIEAIPGKTRGILNHELVIFSKNQIKPTYLIELRK